MKMRPESLEVFAGWIPAFAGMTLGGRHDECEGIPTDDETNGREIHPGSESLSCQSLVPARQG